MRDRIVIATLECIVEYGYENTTMAKIVKMAKVSQGSMQYHFPAKLDAAEMKGRSDREGPKQPGRRSEPGVRAVPDEPAEEVVRLDAAVFVQEIQRASFASFKPSSSSLNQGEGFHTSSFLGTHFRLRRVSRRLAKNMSSPTSATNN